MGRCDIFPLITYEALPFHSSDLCNVVGMKELCRGWKYGLLKVKQMRRLVLIIRLIVSLELRAGESPEDGSHCSQLQLNW